MMAEQFDISTLAWVKGEIDETLKEARIALERYVDDPSDETELSSCISLIHQVAGTLQIVELNGAALFAEEMEAFGDSIKKGRVDEKEQAYELLMRAILQLPDYLESLLDGQDDNPQALVPLLNLMRQQRDEKLLDSADFFRPNLSIAPPPRTAAPPEGIDSAVVAKKLHRFFMSALVKIIKGTELQENLKIVATVLDKLLDVAESDTWRRLLWVSTGFVESLRNETIEVSKESKPLLGKLEQQIKVVAAKGDAVLDDEVVSTILMQMLYLIGNSASLGKVATEISQAFELESYMPKETGGLGGFNAELKQTVSADIMEELSSVKDAFDVFVRSDRSNIQSLKPMAESLARIAETLSLLQEESLKEELQQQVNIISQLLEGKLEVNDENLMGIAATIIAVESALRDWGNESPVVKADAGEEQAAGTDYSPQAAAEHLRVTRQVMKEARDDLVRVREAINLYLENPQDKSILDSLPSLLHMITGSLTLLSYKRVAQVLNSCRAFIQKDLIQAGSIPGSDKLDALADAVMSVEYYLEAFVQSRVHPGSVLDVAESAVTSLGYAPGANVEVVDDTEISAPESTGINVFEAPEFGEASDKQAETPQQELQESTEAGAAVEESSVLHDENTGFKEDVAHQVEITDAYEDSSDASAQMLANEDTETAEEQPDEKEVSQGNSAPDEVDDEIVEIFIEEAEDELNNLRSLFPQWTANPAENEALTDLRRSFHTLKGSGRLVGALVIGDFAWAFENLLNRVLDGTIDHNTAIFDVVEQAIEVLPELIEQFRTGAKPQSDIALLQEMAEQITEQKSGQVSPPHQQSKSAESEQENKSVDIHEDIPELDPVLLEIYSKEADSHLNELDAFISQINSGGSRKVTEPVIRALHTLQGSSRMAGVTGVADVCVRLEKYVKTLQASNEFVDAEGVEALAECVAYVRAVLDYFSEQKGSAFPESNGVLGLATNVLEKVKHLEHVAHAQPEAGLALREESGSVAQIDQTELQPVPPVELEPEAPAEIDLEFLTDFQSESSEKLELEPLTDFQPEASPEQELEPLSDFQPESSEGIELEPLTDFQPESSEGIELEPLTDFQPESSEGIELEPLTDFQPESSEAIELDPLTDFQPESSEGIELEPLTDFQPESSEGIELEPLTDFNPESSEGTELEPLTDFQPESSEGIELEPLSDFQPESSEGIELEPLSDFQPESSEGLELEPLTDFQPESSEGLELESLTNFQSESSAEQELEPQSELQPEPAAKSSAMETPTTEEVVEETIGGSLDDIFSEGLDAVESVSPVDPAATETVGKVTLKADEPAVTTEAPIAGEIFTPDEDYDTELLEIFLEEGADILDASEETLQGWVDNPDDRNLVESLQRQLHTLKGGARMAGITAIGDLSHSLESAVEKVVDGILDRTPEMMDLLQLSHDRLVTMLEQVRNHEPVAQGDDLITKVESLTRGESSSRKEEKANTSADATSVQEEDSTIAEPVTSLTPAASQSVDVPEIEPDLSALEKAVSDVEADLTGWLRDINDKEMFENLQHSGVELGSVSSEFGINEIVALTDAIAELLSAINDGHVPASKKNGDLILLALKRVQLMITQVKTLEPLDSGAALVADIREHITISTAQIGKAEKSAADPDRGLKAADSAAVESENRRRAPRMQQELVRVRSDLLDNLVNYAGEVSIYRSRVEQQIGSFRSSIEEMDHTVVRLREQVRKFDIETETQIESRKEEAQKMGYEDFDPLEFDRFTQMQQLSRSMVESLSDLVSIEDILLNLTRESETLLLQQSRVNTELQESLMHTRMVPLVEYAPRLRRIVRQTSSELGKRANLSFAGADVEMDRNVVERMMAPLEHMLRNSIAHGIEDIQTRLTSGKAEAGSIEIALSREGSEVLVKVSDDGAGINLNAVKKRAIQRGLMKEGAKLSDKEVIGFILESGFSTAESLSQISGRGVGMDVVNSEIKQLGGVLEIESTPGKGTELTVRLPLTLSVSRALLVNVADDVYAIPLISISGIEKIGTDELQTILDSENPVFNWVGEEYDVLHLSGLLGAAGGLRTTDSSGHALLLTKSGDQRIAFAIDGLIGSREIVVKSLGPQLSTLQGLSGATILADGTVALIIDMPSLIRRGLAAKGNDASGENIAGAIEGIEERLVADVEPTVMVVDDSITVRKVTERLLKRHNMKCVTAKDGVDALAVLEEVTPDVMLLDIEMPRMDGFELATHIRNSERLKEIPIIMITSRTGDKHRQRAMAIGVNKYMGKPYTEVDLLENIETLIAGKAQ